MDLEHLLFEHQALRRYLQDALDASRWGSHG